MKNPRVRLPFGIGVVVGVGGTIVLGALLLFLLFPVVLKHRHASAFEIRLGTNRVLAAIPRHYKEAKNPLSPTSANLSSGRGLFVANCSYCHGPLGQINTPVARALYPPAVSLISDRVRNMTDGDIHWIDTHGISFTGMPSFKDILTSDQRWQVVLHIRSLQQKAGP